MADRPLAVLLVEDNPGDARLIEEMLGDSERLLQRLAFEERSFAGTTVHHEESLASGVDRLADSDVDVVLLDLGLPDSAGLASLTQVLEATESVPVVVLTGWNDGAIGIRAIQHGAQDYLVKDEVTSDLLVRSIHYALERHRRARERERQREQLAALNRLNEIGQAISHTVISLSTREALEAAVCRQLTDDEAYQFAWIGEPDRATDRVVPRVSAGDGDEYLDALSGDDGGDSASDADSGPVWRAVTSETIQISRDIERDPAFGPGREAALDRGYRSAAAVPIAYEGYLYGVLTLYDGSPEAFSDPEAAVLSRLGDVIGHAITAIGRKQVLESDTVLELEFAVEGMATALAGATATGDCHVAFSTFVRTDEGVLGYGRAVGFDEPALREYLADAPCIEEVRVLSEGGGAVSFEVLSTQIGPLVEAVTTHGGRVESATVDDGEVCFVAVFAPGRDKRQLVELVHDHCPDAVHRAQRLVERTDESATAGHPSFLDSLTEQQRTILETAYRGGLFAWPRESTETELADRLGIAPPTFNQHLRAAEAKLFGEVFGDGREEPPDPNP